MSFKHIAELLDISGRVTRILNPIYKLKVIPFEGDKPLFAFTKNKNGIICF